MAITVEMSAMLVPRIERLADDAWVLAQRAPTLVADPALVAEAGQLLGVLRRMLCSEPGHRLLPKSFAPGIGLHALALSLRQLQAATALFVARRQSGPTRQTADEIDDINRIIALALRGIANRVAAQQEVALPPELRAATPPSPPPPPRGEPPPPRPAILRARRRRQNGKRRRHRLLD